MHSLTFLRYYSLNFRVTLLEGFGCAAFPVLFSQLLVLIFLVLVVPAVAEFLMILHALVQLVHCWKLMFLLLFEQVNLVLIV